MLKPLKTIIFTIILGMVYIMPTVARAACAENEIDVLGDGTQCETAKFTITTTEIADGEVFQFYMSAKGTFYVDWGDGTVETITRTYTNSTNYTHTYTDAGVKTIRFGGLATDYSNTAYGSCFSTISFATNEYVEKIAGSLGAIFPTTATGKQPCFASTFEFCLNLTGSIPAGLFSGISGAPIDSMFDRTFSASEGLTGVIPAGLFGGLSGTPAIRMFYNTFTGCSGLTGSIPEGLFGGISGAPARSMFENTFLGCSGLTGSIPAGLFSGISGAPANSMFSQTFAGCSGLTGSIPAGLFSGISGAPASSMFNGTFMGCTNLTGSIPENLFAAISGAPASSMFQYTFYNCYTLSGYVPPTLFQGITGTTGDMMFNIFYNSGLVTECPCTTKQYITGFESYWSGKVACEPDPTQHYYNDVCVADCDAGVTTLRTSTGLEFPLFDTNPTTPSLHIQHNGTVCYTPMELGDGGANSMNIMSGGAAYHLGTLE